MQVVEGDEGGVQGDWAGKLCDAGYHVVFKRDTASVIHDTTGATVGEFPRKQGLYIGNLQLRNPKAATPFTRQA